MLLRPFFGRCRVVSLLLLVGIQGSLAQAQAGQGSGLFSISITLTNPAVAPGVLSPGTVSPAGRPPLLGGLYGQSLCVSASFEAPTEATVRVVCGGSEYVAIAPETGAPDPRVIGEVYRTRFGPGAAGRPAWVTGLRPGLLAGTGATYQVQRLSDWDDPLQLLVSF